MKQNLLNDLKKYDRKSNRLKGFDYSSAGMYFITICTQNRQCIFEEIANEVFIINEIGKMIEQHWLQIQDDFCNIKLDSYIIMPNHLHGLIIIEDDTVRSRLVSDQCIGTRATPSEIGDIICAFKSKTTNCYIKNVKENN